MTAMIHLLWLVVMLSWCLEDVNSRFPYVSFRGQTLANHSYMDLSQVGDDASGSDSVQCHTDLSTCCRNTYGSHRGNWFFPDRYRVPFRVDITQNRSSQRVDQRRRNNALSPVGIYRCNIPTRVVHDDYSNSVSARVYVGLYTSGGMFHVLAMMKPILVSP